MKYLLILATMFSFSLSYANFGNCEILFPNKRSPKVSVNEKTRELCFTDFAILYSVDKKSPIYCMQKLSYQTINIKVKRKDHFHEEPKLAPSERSSPKDYAKSGYDKGHVCNARDQHSEIAMEESFSMSNMVPETKQTNRSIWSKNVEEATRKYVMRASGDVFVFTGQFYPPNPERIGKNQVAVPSHIWKLVYDSEKKKSWVHWIENSETAKMSPPISYEEFVKRTGLKLLD
jgi:endonuclease G, mitochondrial